VSTTDHVSNPRAILVEGDTSALGAPPHSLLLGFILLGCTLRRLLLCVSLLISFLLVGFVGVLVCTSFLLLGSGLSVGLVLSISACLVSVLTVCSGLLVR
jgi:hypothetical protein